MQSDKHISPSEYYKPEDSPQPQRLRQPLQSLEGNAQPLLAIQDYHGYKVSQSGLDMQQYSNPPTVPSQPHHEADLTKRFDYHHRHRERHRHDHKRARGPQKLDRNPIADSKQYQAYRNRNAPVKKSAKKGEVSDTKWPDVLEDAFLDGTCASLSDPSLAYFNAALINIPQMQRRKFSFNGKLHGRNELITKYLWFAYRDSLPPHASMDEDWMYDEKGKHYMERDRKQVSSHIQVLKGFLTGHKDSEFFNRHISDLHLIALDSVGDIMFPPTKGAGSKNVVQESFQHDACLKGLSEGRLPDTQYHSKRQKPEIKPMEFSLALAADDETDSRVLHNFSTLMAVPNRPTNLDSIRGWQDRFPYLHQSQARRPVPCPIIHMSVSLALLQGSVPDHTHLRSRTQLSVPITLDTRNCNWQSVATLDLPKELCNNTTFDGRLRYPPVNQKVFPAKAQQISDVLAVNIPFPVEQFAAAFSALVGIQAHFVQEMESRELDRHHIASPVKHAGEYVEKMTMYQELQSQSAPGQPFVTRAVFLWTFRELDMNASNNTTWRYLDPSPPQRTIMSPSPAALKRNFESMQEGCNEWPVPQLMMHTNNVLNSYGHGLATPPHTASLQSSYDSDVTYSVFQQQQQQRPYDMQNGSFMSNKTLDSDVTLVDGQASNLESFMSNDNTCLVDYDQNQASWQMPLPPSHNFDQDPTWANGNNYAVPSSTPVMGSYVDQHVVQSWADPELQDVKPLLGNVATFKQIEHDIAHEHAAWNSQSPMQHKHSRFDQTQAIDTIEQRLMLWQDHFDQVAGDSYGFAHVPDQATGRDEELRLSIEIGMGDALDIHIQQEEMDNTMMDTQNLEGHTLVGNPEGYALGGEMKHMKNHTEDHALEDRLEHTIEHPIEDRLEDMIEHTTQDQLDHSIDHTLEAQLDHTSSHSMEHNIDHAKADEDYDNFDYANLAQQLNAQQS